MATLEAVEQPTLAEDLTSAHVGRRIKIKGAHESQELSGTLASLKFSTDVKYRGNDVITENLKVEVKVAFGTLIFGVELLGRTPVYVDPID